MFTENIEPTEPSEKEIKDFILSLHDKGVKYEEIAVLLGVSLDTIRNWIYRNKMPGKASLRKIYSLWKEVINGEGSKGRTVCRQSSTS